MKKLENLKQLKKIHVRIKHSTTGNPVKLAKEIGVTRRQLFAYLDYLRDLGAVIAYDRLHDTYYYENYFDLKISLHMATVTDKGKQIIYTIK